MSRTALATQFGHLQPHDHVCLLHGSEGERLQALVPFLRAGLAAGERCIHLAGEADGEGLRQALATAGLDVPAALASGALVLSSDRSSFLAQGRFAPAAAGEFLEATARQAQADGCPGLRITGHVAWEMGGDPGPDDLLAWETAVQRVVARQPLRALCQIDGRRFSAGTQLAAVRSHPLLVEGGRLSRNPCFVPPDEALDPDREARQLRRLLRQAREREETEERLRQDGAFRKRLLDAKRLAAAGAVAGALAHEINGPLGWIGSNLKVLQEALDRLSPEAVGGPGALEELRACLGDALDGTARVRDAVASLRALRQVNGAPDGGPADVAAEVSLALDTVRLQAEPRAALEADLPPDLPQVALPGHQLGQVLVSLLIEALQRIPEGQPAEHWVRVSAATEPGSVLVEVADSGVAMGPDLQRRLFEPLFGARAEAPGLRLALCHLLVSSAGGTIEAESGPERGSRVRLHLPAARAVR